MRISRSFTGSTLLVAVVLGVAGSSQAQTITLSSAWYTQDLNGTTGAGLLQVAGNATNPLSANSSNSWNVVSELGVTKQYAFTNAITATVFDLGIPVDNLIRQSKVNFTGAGSSDVNVLQAISAFDKGTTAGLVFNASSPTQFLTSPSSSFGYLWSVKFNAVTPADQTFTAGSTTFALPSNTMDVTLVAMIPEPATMALFGLGLAPVAVAIRRRRK
jgi:PEP-CTERM motif